MIDNVADRQRWVDADYASGRIQHGDFAFVRKLGIEHRRRPAIPRARCPPGSPSSAGRRIRVTPCVFRPTRATSAARVRTRVPWLEISISSCAASSCTAPTRLPLRAEHWIAITPCVPRPLRGYSASSVRLPGAALRLVRISPAPASLPSPATTIRLTTRSLAARRMPRTASRGTSHRPHAAFVETHGLAVGGEQHDVARTVGDLHVNERIALIEPGSRSCPSCNWNANSVSGVFLAVRTRGGEEHKAGFRNIRRTGATACTPAHWPPAAAG